MNQSEWINLAYYIESTVKRKRLMTTFFLVTWLTFKLILKHRTYFDYKLNYTIIALKVPLSQTLRIWVIYGILQDIKTLLDYC